MNIDEYHKHIVWYMYGLYALVAQSIFVSIRR